MLSFVNLGSNPNVVNYVKNLSNASNWTTIPAPTPVPSGNLNGVAISTDDNYLAIASGSSPYISIYVKNISNASNWTNLDNPGTLPTGAGNGVAFSNDGNYLAVAHSTTPYLTIYSIIGDAPDTPVASFTTNTTSGLSPLNVAFTDTSN